MFEGEALKLEAENACRPRATDYKRMRQAKRRVDNAQGEYGLQDILDTGVPFGSPFKF